MDKINEMQILIEDAQLNDAKLQENNTEINKLIEESQKRQEDVLRLKVVDQDSLRMVVQL